MTERNQVWDHIRDLVAYSGRWDRVENHSVPGMPDVNACVNGCEFWVENKLGDLEGTRPTTLRYDQVLWFERQCAAGGKVYLLVLYPKPIRVWCIYDTVGIRKLWNGEHDPIMRVEGKFPTVEFMKTVRTKCRD